MKVDPSKNAKTVATDTMSINLKEAARLKVATAMPLKHKENQVGFCCTSFAPSKLVIKKRLLAVDSKNSKKGKSIHKLWLLLVEIDHQSRRPHYKYQTN